MTLELENVTKRFGGVIAVSEVTLTLPEGKIIGLIGPNGSGKSTLFHTIAGYHRADGGTIRYNEKNIQRWPSHKVARSGIIRTFQNRMLFGGLTAHENVAVTAKIAGSNEDADELLAFVGLTDSAHTESASLPFGIARKLAIAIALAAAPSLLLLDEPAAGLNDAESHELAMLIKRLQSERGIHCWVIDHDMLFLMGLADYVFVMDTGRLIAQGTPTEVQNSSIVRERYLGS